MLVQSTHTRGYWHVTINGRDFARNTNRVFRSNLFCIALDNGRRCSSREKISEGELYFGYFRLLVLLRVGLEFSYQRINQEGIIRDESGQFRKIVCRISYDLYRHEKNFLEIA